MACGDLVFLQVIGVGNDVMETYWASAENGVMMRRRIERHIIPEGLSRSEYGLLGAARILGPCPITTLAKRLLTVNSNVTYILDKLVDKGYAVRERSAEDARSYNVVLTESGVSLADEMIAGRDMMAEFFLSELNDEEKKDLFDSVLKIKRRIDQLDAVHPESLSAEELDSLRNGWDRLPDHYELKL